MAFDLNEIITKMETDPETDWRDVDNAKEAKRILEKSGPEAAIKFVKERIIDDQYQALLLDAINVK